jgi:hypothetical protein
MSAVLSTASFAETFVQVVLNTMTPQPDELLSEIQKRRRHIVVVVTPDISRIWIAGMTSTTNSHDRAL